jgi:hypothetical protein
MSQIVAESNWQEPVKQQDVKTSPDPSIAPKYTDAAVLSIVVQDKASASAWLKDNRWPLQWRESDMLHQSPKGFAVFEGSNVTRSNVSDFTVATQTNSIAPAMQQAVFSDPTPFLVRPRPNVTEAAARGWTALLSWALDECDFKGECYTGIEHQVGLGTVIYKAGWETEDRIEEHYIRKAAPAQINVPMQPTPITVFTEESDEFDVEERVVTRNRPTFEQVPLDEVFIDPKWNKPNQLWKAKFIVHEKWITYDDLSQLRNNPLYDIPSDDELRAILDPQDPEQTVSATDDSLDQNGAIHHAERQDKNTSADPLLRPLQILERWTDTDCQVVLQEKVVIRKGPHMMPGKPFFAANFWNMFNAGYGIGTGRLSGSAQRVKQGTKNAALDIIAMAVQPDYVVSRGANAPIGAMRQRLGGITMVDGNAREAFMLKEQPKVPSEVWNMLQLTATEADTNAGADQAVVQGIRPGAGGSITRTATGAGGLMKAASTRIQSPVDKFVDGVMLPFLKFLWQMMRERMPISEIREVLGEQMTADVLPDMYDLMNAKVKFEVLAGTRLAAKAAMAQSLPFMLQVFENPQIAEQLNATGQKINWIEVFNMVMDVSEWKNQRALIVPMTDQEKQMQQQQNKAVQDLQTKIQLLMVKHKNDMELEDQKQQGRTSGHLIETAAEHAVGLQERDQDEKMVAGSPYFSNQ